MIDAFFAGYGVGSGGLGGPKVGDKTAFAVVGIAATLGILYLVFRKPDPPGYWRDQLEAPKSGRTQRADQVRGWGHYR